MTDCPPPIPIVVRLVDVMRDIKYISKDQRNSAQGFNFRGIDDVLNAVGPAFRNHGVLIRPEVRDIQLNTRTGSNGRTLNHCVVTVAYHFMCDAGAMEVVTYGEAMDAGDKVVSKAMSVALRTALIQAFAIPTGEPDPDQDTYEMGDAEEKAEPNPELRKAALRREIARLGANNGLSVDVIAKQFLAATGTPIQAADADTLAAYLNGERK